MFKATFIILLMLCGSVSYGASTRTVYADGLASADTTKSYSLPTISGGVMVSSGLVAETPSGTINGSNTSFTLSFSAAQSASLQVMLDGLVLIPTTEYSISGTTLTMVTAPATAQKLTVRYSRF